METPGSQSSLHRANLERVVRAVRLAGSLTQAEIARTTGLSAATVSNIVRELKDGGTVEVTPTSAGGRRARSVSLSGDAGIVIGVDFGHQHLRVAVGNLAHQVLAEEAEPLDVDASAAQGLGIATVYQDLALCDNIDVVGNLYLGRELRKRGVLDEVEMERRSRDLLDQLSIRIPSVRIPIASLSGGQRQVVAIARSMLGEPKLVILDEPTAALGVEQTAQVLDLVERLRERGHAVILISHNMADVKAVADKVAVLRLGRNNGVFDVASTSQEEIISAITGATDNAVTRRAARSTKEVQK